MTGHHQDAPVSDNLRPAILPSTTLRQAQERLAQLREQRGTAATQPPFSPTPTETIDAPTAVQQLPAHLGWGSAPLTAVIRHAKQEDGTQAFTDEHRFTNQHICENPCLSVSHSQNATPQKETIILHPDLGLALLREEQTAAGRVWLLLRHLDRTGRGWLTATEARELLTGVESPYRICGERQLRKLLAQGDGLFWIRKDSRIWLRSISKTAGQLGVQRMGGRPVHLPVKALLGGIGDVRAHLYAAFHSGRGGAVNKPIARATLQSLSKVSRRSQRNYEQRAGIRRQRNLAVGELNTDRNRERRGQQQGRALFTFTDEKGKHGPAGREYLAWQLPNSYIGPHTAAPQGRQKRINRELADLFMQGMTGNGQELIDRAHQPQRRFQVNGAQAAKQFNRDGASDLYWPKTGGNGRSQLWHLLPGQSGTNAA